VLEPGAPVDVFLSYASEDENLLRKVEKHLAVLQRRELIRSFHAGDVTAGQDWRAAVDEHLERAGVILLLVSADFLASSRCYDEEVARAIDRHHRGEARVVPIIVRACAWEDASFGALKPLPRDGRPVTSWGSEDDALTDVARGIREIVKQHTKGSAEDAGQPSKGRASSPGRSATDGRGSAVISSAEVDARTKIELANIEKETRVTCMWIAVGGGVLIATMGMLAAVAVAALIVVVAGRGAGKASGLLRSAGHVGVPLGTAAVPVGVALVIAGAVSASVHVMMVMSTPAGISGSQAREDSRDPAIVSTPPADAEALCMDPVYEEPLASVAPEEGDEQDAVSSAGSGKHVSHGAMLGGQYKNKPEQVRMEATQVSGRLSSAVITDIVQRQTGRFRLCFENGLRNNPTLSGRVSVRFVIGHDGAVSQVSNGGSDMPDSSVVSCVVRSFYGISFPQPEGGIVTITMPVVFAAEGPTGLRPRVGMKFDRQGNPVPDLSSADAGAGDYTPTPPSIVVGDPQLIHDPSRKWHGRMDVGPKPSTTGISLPETLPPAN
jgi:hypothetical protein